ncbi:hypothetical protein PQR75_40720 [Paraburkholderia fungorum]|uniref:hypothetical protein n=1 Tax=Paraburkholderia fungorum TaxID=134537 RepID=UPI0038B6FC59
MQRSGVSQKSSASNEKMLSVKFFLSPSPWRISLYLKRGRPLRYVIRFVAFMVLALGGTAHALTFECKVLREPSRPFVRIVFGETEREANAAFINAYGNQVRRVYGPDVRFKCSYPPSKEALESVPGENLPYKTCPSGKKYAENRADSLEELQHDCGPPLPGYEQMFFVSYWAQARDLCRFAMANDQYVVLTAATTLAANLEYLPFWKAAEAQLKIDGCSPATRQLAESTLRYLTRTGDPKAERPFIATCVQRENMSVQKCRCYGDAIRLIDPVVFHRIYNGPSYGEMVREVGPLWEGQLTLLCRGVRPN